MNTRILWVIVLLLLVIIGFLAWFLFALPAPAEAPTVATSTPTVTDTTPTTALHDRIVVSSPKAGATVASTFTVTGKVPGNWSFEAQFPVQVRDAENSKIGQTTGHVEGDWMTDQLVDFTATLTVTGYHGPATLVLLKDNPSGLPENDDSIEIPIVIQ